MDAVYLEYSVDTAQPPAADDCVASDSLGLLHGVLRVSQEWLEQVPLCDPQHDKLVRLGILAADLVRMSNFSPTAMTTARALLCVNCRRLNAAQGQCAGQSLDRCLLLKGTDP
ncbi:MAG: hypothetical protein M0P95_16135 [Sulfuritalea sp.]|jgi:hypothetical protein|nr:hypothetical protein [Sulfuritalea sp.]